MERSTSTVEPRNEVLVRLQPADAKDERHTKILEFREGQAYRLGRSFSYARNQHFACFPNFLVSRTHALMFLHAGKVYLVDAQSAHGTWVNEERLRSERDKAIWKEVRSILDNHAGWAPVSNLPIAELVDLSTEIKSGYRVSLGEDTIRDGVKHPRTSFQVLIYSLSNTACIFSTPSTTLDELELELSLESAKTGDEESEDLEVEESTTQEILESDSAATQESVHNAKEEKTSEDGYECRRCLEVHKSMVCLCFDSSMEPLAQPYADYHAVSSSSTAAEAAKRKDGIEKIDAGTIADEKPHSEVHRADRAPQKLDGNRRTSYGIAESDLLVEDSNEEAWSSVEEDNREVLAVATDKKDDVVVEIAEEKCLIKSDESPAPDQTSAQPSNEQPTADTTSKVEVSPTDDKTRHRDRRSPRHTRKTRRVRSEQVSPRNKPRATTDMNVPGHKGTSWLVHEKSPDHRGIKRKLSSTDVQSALHATELSQELDRTKRTVKRLKLVAGSAYLLGFLAGGVATITFLASRIGEEFF